MAIIISDEDTVLFFFYNNKIGSQSIDIIQRWHGIRSVNSNDIHWEERWSKNRRLHEFAVGYELRS